jgi:pentapeptide MXKDX repeat protein
MRYAQTLRPFGALLAVALILSACAAPAAGPAPAAPAASEAMTEEPMPEEAMTEEAMTEEAMTEEAMTEEAVTEEAMTEEAMTEEATSEEATSEVPAVERAAWQSIPLTDARTGAAFTLADYAGKTVFVEPFATWCSNCRQQLANVHAARQQAGEEVIFVALSVETNIGNEALAAYAADTGYDLVFAAMPPEMLQALAAQFGQTISNPPATPHFVIRPDGSTSELVTGIEATEAILAQVAAQ